MPGGFHCSKAGGTASASQYHPMGHGQPHAPGLLNRGLGELRSSWTIDDHPQLPRQSILFIIWQLVCRCLQFAQGKLHIIQTFRGRRNMSNWFDSNLQIHRRTLLSIALVNSQSFIFDCLLWWNCCLTMFNGYQQNHHKSSHAYLCTPRVWITTKAVDVLQGPDRLEVGHFCNSWPS